MSQISHQIINELWLDVIKLLKYKIVGKQVYWQLKCVQEKLIFYQNKICDKTLSDHRGIKNKTRAEKRRSFASRFQAFNQLAIQVG